MEMLYLSLSGNPRRVQLRPINTSTQALGSIISTLTLPDPPSVYNFVLSDDYILAYLPNKIHYFGGNTALLLINREALISYHQCHQVNPVCQLFTFGGDGLHFGKPFMYVSDMGGHYVPRQSWRPYPWAGTYGIGVSGCNRFTFACVSDFEVTVVCLRPPDHKCG